MSTFPKLRYTAHAFALFVLLIAGVPNAWAQSSLPDDKVGQPKRSQALGASLAHNVLLLGDSITVGHTAEPGFRDDLYTMLSGVAGHSFTFLGSSGTAPLNGHFLGGRQANHFYSASFGNGWGWGTFDMTPHMGPVVPEVVCFIIGTNDLDVDHPPFGPYSRDHGYSLTPGQAGQFAEAVQFLARWGDGTLSTDLKTIVLSTLVPMENRQQDVVEFNESIVALSEDLAEGIATGSPVRVLVADPNRLFVANPALFTYGAGDWMTDSLHPNNTGYTEMANVYFDAITAATADFVRPEAIHDLSVVSTTDTTVTLTFSATGNDGDVGSAARYDLRVGTDSVDKHSFARTFQATGEPIPAASGATETIVVEGLLSGTAYEFAIKATDAGGNRSGLSNVVSAATSGSSISIITLQAGLNGYRGVEDNSLTSGPINGNMGGHESIFSGLIGMSTIRRGALRFDLDFLPRDIEVLDARLRLYNHGSESGSTSDVSVYRLTKRWVQGAETLFDRQGTSSWSSSQWGYHTWSAPGAEKSSDSARNDDPAYDRFATPEGTVQVSALDVWYEWDVTAAAAHWVARDWNNEGLLLRTDMESAGSGRHFHSSEYVTDPSLRPTLILTVQSAGN